jgi:hypothetical protein
LALGYVDIALFLVVFFGGLPSALGAIFGMLWLFAWWLLSFGIMSYGGDAMFLKHTCESICSLGTNKYNEV